MSEANRLFAIAMHLEAGADDFKASSQHGLIVAKNLNEMPALLTAAKDRAVAGKQHWVAALGTGGDAPLLQTLMGTANITEQAYLKLAAIVDAQHKHVDSVVQRAILAERTARQAAAQIRASAQLRGPQ